MGTKAAAQSYDTFDPYQQSHPCEPAPLDFSPSDLTWMNEGATQQAWDTHGPALGWEPLPAGTIYPLYLADVKASRMAGVWSGGDEGLVDGTLGGRFGLLRHNQGGEGPYMRGMQIDTEGSANVRLIPGENMDVKSVDFRAGVPVSFGFGRLHTRFGYYHLSSHVGDEYLLKRPDFNRLNFSRDVLFIGAGYWLTPATRIYGEAGWAFYSDISKEWEFMFGIERAPRFATGMRGQPFYAIQGHLREELDFGGHFNSQIGWAWRRNASSGLFRIGLQYFNGKSQQYSFYQQNEQQLGFGLWYDY
ncbi:hypothetical protein FF011L_35860 [Roseimaritima multifibrata]|uniref:DUF1207 domain-containing protein n=1 Tax=Roseimaritima multifibrata TaxID=1930274 RepID=A0A517MIX4_9BACT|nr:DUF1207 domain-containing protein [Roseimaritima multifibrata]QDS94804.1 hypothetical protein FF011L_35860 [Roseimaritima multifibrata]